MDVKWDNLILESMRSEHPLPSYSAAEPYHSLPHVYNYCQQPLSRNLLDLYTSSHSSSDRLAAADVFPC